MSRKNIHSRDTRCRTDSWMLVLRWLEVIILTNTLRMFIELISTRSWTNRVNQFVHGVKQWPAGNKADQSRQQLKFNYIWSVGWYSRVKERTCKHAKAPGLPRTSCCEMKVITELIKNIEMRLQLLSQCDYLVF